MDHSATSAPTHTAAEATISTHTRTAAMRASIRTGHNGPMRVVVTRVAEASVEVDGEVVGRLRRPGLLVLAGVGHDDTADDAAALARKIWGLRILDGELSASDVGAPLLVVSQFTLYASTRKGRRPSWSGAAPGHVGEPLVEQLCRDLEALGAHVERGRFGAHMRVASVNDGPVTILIDTKDWD
ncbi:D-aminoacyl-tRNA deacylase [Tessaracoccus sp. O5.2]